SIALQPVWEGLARHAWDDAQLRELEQMLSQVNFVSESAEMLRAERAYSLRVLDLMLRSPGELGQSQSEVLQLGIPSGRGLLHRLLPAVIYRNELAIARMYQEDLLARLDTDRQAVDVVGLWAADTDPAIRTLKKQALLRPYSAMADAMLPAVASSTEKFTLIHAYVVLARVACALERHRLADGDYPADLQALVPDYLPALPADPAGGGVLFYRRLSANNFLLYSGGPNARDDGGKIVRRDNPNHGADPRNEKSDWVWTYPSGE
ncbi:MAG: hypothetical protein KDM81_21215, partial [Verrucomicrobiae bacterium]|nr:hypothetical protein [Verrucomicrobiae bacterium]